MKKVEELDAARVVSMLAVIAIHVTAPYIGAGSRFLLGGMNLAYVMNQAARFAVPLFVLLSGASLGLGKPLPPAKFYRRRFGKLGIPYVCWFVAYTLYENQSLTPGILVRRFLLGQAAPHLYFITIIFQLYLLYPLLRRWMERSTPGCLLGAFLVTYGVEKLIVVQRGGFSVIPGPLRPYLWQLFPTWLFYFVLGMAATRENLGRLQQFAARHRAAIAAAAVVFTGLYVLESKATGDIEAIKSTLNVHTPLVLLAVFALWPPLAAHLRWLRPVTAFLARHSMTVYFGHVLILTRLRMEPVFAVGMRGMLLQLAAVTALAIPGAWCVDTAVGAVRSVFLRQSREKISAR
ncbi:acyltransferase [uncultured Oscillibacter sp.]|uniref:acyltransferase n=1 Tax=uncultured Oscillibacter sp. TaxID=876091 RepID=UPI0025D8D652|nr:acyltransferase [uncultured Oscillibacter sp.]